MIHQLVTFALLLFMCNAQEHLTCLRTDDVLTPTSSPAPPRVQQGVPGRRGPVGAKGDTGSDGAKGYAGSDGTKGDTGSDGAKGGTGSDGAKGDIGSDGTKGDTGSDGAKGYAGSDGTKGDTGSDGAKGGTGSDGAKGDIGSDGTKGDTGSDGAKGNPGSDGSKGDTGSDGAKGIKGDAGVPDTSRIASLQRELTTLRQLVGALNASNNELRRAVIGIVDGWYAPLNGYEYKVTPNTQSWDESRVICQGWGGDLAVHGIQTLDSRNNIIRGLSLTTRYWIGANDKENEGTWKWVNGDDATNEQIMWIPGQPDNAGNNEDCLEIWLFSNYNGRSNDAPCSSRLNGLCEKSF